MCPEMCPQVRQISGVPMARAGPMPGTHQSHSDPAPTAAQGTENGTEGSWLGIRSGRDPSANSGTATTDPAWAQRGNLLPTKSQQHKERGEKSLQQPSPHPTGSPGPGITRALPNGGHWGSSNTNPPMWDGAGAEHEALPTLGALSGLPSVVPPLVLGQVRALGPFVSASLHRASPWCGCADG